MDNNNSSWPPPRKNNRGGKKHTVFIPSSNKNDLWIPNPEGTNKLREILNSMDDHDHPDLESNPVYMLGYADGRIAATEESKCVVRGLMKMWDDKDE